MLGDIRDVRWLYIKAMLLLLVGLLAMGIVLIELPSLRIAALLCAMVWAFCRAYYFAFYVVEKYADPGFRFAGLFDFARYLWRQRRRVREGPSPAEQERQPESGGGQQDGDR